LVELIAAPSLLELVGVDDGPSVEAPVVQADVRVQQAELQQAQAQLLQHLAEVAPVGRFVGQRVGGGRGGLMWSLLIGGP
jgi:hypothetical protein